MKLKEKRKKVKFIWIKGGYTQRQVTITLIKTLLHQKEKALLVKSIFIT